LSNIIKKIKEIYYTKKNIDSTSRQEFEKILKYSKHSDWHPDLEHTALLVLDCQNYFFDKNSHAYIPSANAILNNIISLCELFRQKSLPIFFTSHINYSEKSGLFKKWWNKLVEPESVNSKIINELESFSKELIIKHKYDAFYSTKLNKLLIENKIKDLIITGVMTHLCCETTIRSAFMKDYRTFFVFDATADYNLYFHKASFINLSHGFTTPLLSNHILRQFNDRKK
jgi:isochorismate hydrolase